MLDSWMQLIGPVATPHVMAELLGVDRSKLNRLRRAGRVLSVRGQRSYLYPLRQLSDDGTAVRAELVPLLAVLIPANSGAGATRWLATPNKQLDGQCPWDALEDRANDERVMAAALRQIAAWTGC